MVTIGILGQQDATGTGAFAAVNIVAIEMSAAVATVVIVVIVVIVVDEFLKVVTAAR